MATEFNSAILQLSDRIKRTLQFIPDDIKNLCEEIRLRAGLPLCLTVKGRVLFVCKNSTVLSVVSSDCFVVSDDEINQTLSLICNKSVYLHEGEIRQGFVSMTQGGRAGVCGIFNAEGMLVAVTSINIRIARQIIGCADCLLPYTDGGLLIAGPPGCGKTTLLRDIVRSLSNGYNGRFYRVSVIDSRGEITGRNGTLDTGVNTDVLYTADKAKGTDIALRTMFPDFIAFDEIGTAQELESVSGCFNAGVGVITTAHCNKKDDIMRRKITRAMLESGAISNLALLSDKVGTKPEIFKVKELLTGVVC